MAAKHVQIDLHSELETALLAKPYYHSNYEPPATIWRRRLSTLAQRMQLHLRHRLGITVSLPSLAWNPTRRWPQSSFMKPSRRKCLLRRGLYALLFAPVLFLALVILYGGIPPSYWDVTRRERALPQHHWASTGARLIGGTRGARSTHGLTDGESGESEAQEMFLRFPDHVWGHGLNNVLQEAILTTHLTLATSTRTPVFEPYTWSHLPLPYTLYDFTLRPTRVPLSAFLGGVLTGEVASNDSTVFGDRSTRRAVSAEYFEYICPPGEIVEVVYGLSGEREDVDVDETNPSTAQSTESRTEHTARPHVNSPYLYPYPAPASNAYGREIRVWFERRLRAPDVRGKRCVVVREDGEKVPGARRVFDTDFFGSSHRILPMLPELLASPVLKQFEWSPLVRHAVDRSVGSLFPASSHPESLTRAGAGDYDGGSDADSDDTEIKQLESVQVITPAPRLEGVLAVHLRRGDYARHCVRLAEWSSGYLGVNAAIGDRFEYIDEGEENTEDTEGDVNGDSGEAEKEARKAKRKEAYYLQHCLPSIEQIVHRLSEVRAEYDKSARGAQPIRESGLSDANATSRTSRLRNVYVLTNGWPAFVDALREALLADGWEGVVATPDLEHGVRAGQSNVGWPGWYFGSGQGAKRGFEGLTRDERGVDVAVDMGIAERAEVFVGNGFSSLSANIVMLRMARGRAVNRLL